MCPVCLRLTCSIKNRPKFVQSSVPRLALPCPCLSFELLPLPVPPLLSSLLTAPACTVYKFLGVCVPCAECRQQLRLNSNWHLMISCRLSLSLFPSIAALVTHSHCPSGAPAAVPGTPPASTLALLGSGPPAATSAAAVAAATNLSALASQHRLLELSRFGLRGYDLAQHMLSQQGAVSKLLGK